MITQETVATFRILVFLHRISLSVALLSNRVRCKDGSSVLSFVPSRVAQIAANTLFSTVQSAGDNGRHVGQFVYLTNHSLFPFGKRKSAQHDCRKNWILDALCLILILLKSINVSYIL